MLSVSLQSTIFDFVSDEEPLIRSYAVMLIEMLNEEYTMKELRNNDCQAAFENGYQLFKSKEILHHPVNVSVPIVVKASSLGYVQVLKWLSTKGQLEYSQDAIDAASANGHVDVLNWWAARRTVEQSQNTINRATENGHVHVLNWWAARGPLKCSTYTFRIVNSMKNQAIHAWWNAWLSK